MSLSDQLEDQGPLTIRARLREAFDGLLEGCSLLGPDYRYVYLNQSALRHARRPAEEVVGRTLMEVFPGIEATPLFHHVRECRLESKPCRLETEFVYPDGARAWFDLSMQARFGGVFIQSLEITERKLAELALLEKTERLQQLADTIQEVFWLTDIEKGTMVYVSPGYEKIWGRSCESLYASPQEWIEAIHPEDRDRVRQAALTKQGLGNYDEEYRILRPDGAVRWIRDRGFPVRDSSGSPTRVAGSAQDVTKRRELEAQLMQTQKLESIGLLAGGVAHDFNNLLTVISSSSHELLELLEQNAECTEIVGDIRTACDRAKGLTRQLLSFSRREVVAPRVVDLAALVADTEKMLRRLLSEDVLMTLFTGSEPACVNVDPGSWVQVLVNLAVNARDAMPRGGKLEISVRQEHLDEGVSQRSLSLPAGSYVVLSVGDTGTGMAEDVQARMFEPFFTTKGLGKGTGMGLSVVHGIVSQSGGCIVVKSQLGAGTTFRIYLPQVPDPPHDSVRFRSKSKLPGTETILVVEDESSLRRIAARALQKQGYKVLEGEDGADALTIARDHPDSIDLLVTDVVMPHMDGRALAEALRAIHPRVRILFTSGYTDDDVMRYGILHSEVEFLPKPYDLADLRHKVRDVLDKA